MEVFTVKFEDFPSPCNPSRPSGICLSVAVISARVFMFKKKTIFDVSEPYFLRSLPVFPS